jgi:DNA-directed RNA polymerase specialized sigma24 family protein
MARATGRPDASAGHSMPTPPSADTDELVRDLYQAHALALIRAAKLLLRDQPSAEDAVQDAFLGLYQALPRLSDHDQVLPYLRAAVINRSRSVLRARRRALLRKVGQHRPVAARPPRGDRTLRCRLGCSRDR